MSVYRTLRSSVVIGYMLSIAWVRRNLLSLVWLFATPFSILFLITVTSGGHAFVQATIGTIIFVLATVGTGLAGDATWYRLETKLQDLFVASPVSQMGYLLGISLAGLFFAAPALVILLPVLVYLGLPMIDLPLTILAVCSVWIFSATIGYIVSTYMTNLRNGWQSGLLLSVVVAVIPPAFYPAEVLPTSVLPIAYLIPTTNAALLLRGFMGETISLPYWSPLFGWGMLGLSILAVLLVMLRLARWRQL